MGNYSSDFAIYNFTELHLTIKTTTVPAPPRYNIEVVKPRKPPAHTKNKPVKYKRPKTERKNQEIDDEIHGNDEQDQVTTSWNDIRVSTLLY